MTIEAAVANPACSDCPCRAAHGHRTEACSCRRCNPWGQPLGLYQGSTPIHWCGPVVA